MGSSYGHVSPYSPQGSISSLQYGFHVKKTQMHSWLAFSESWSCLLFMQWGGMVQVKCLREINKDESAGSGKPVRTFET